MWIHACNWVRNWDGGMERKETQFRGLGSSKVQLLTKKRQARSHAWAMHSMPPELSEQSQMLLTQSIMSLRQGKVINQVWFVPAKSRRRRGQRQVRRQVTPWFWGLYPEQLPAVQILSSARSRTTNWHYSQHRSGSSAKKEFLDAWGAGRGLQWGHSRQLLPISGLRVLTCFAVLELL